MNANTDSRTELKDSEGFLDGKQKPRQGFIPPSEKSILPHWNTETYSKYVSRVYDLVTTITGWRRNLLHHALEDLTPGSLLDLGCGTGYLLDFAKKAGFSSSGVDLSWGMLHKAREQENGEELSLTLASASQLPFSDESFDIVLASGALVHIPKIDQVCREMLRVLRPGGTIRIVDHAKPLDKTVTTPFFFALAQATGDVFHDYPHFFQREEGCTLVSHKTLGRGGFLQRFDFRKIGF